MQNVKLNLIPGSVMPVVNVSQYDKARQFSLTVYEGASAYSLTGKDVQIRGTKPDGNGFAYDSTDDVVSVSGSTVTISTTQQMTAVGGQTMAELRITSGDTILGTLNFVLMVEPSALSDDTPISETDIPVIERDFQAALAEAEADALVAEGYAKGTQGGVPVGSESPYYNNNAEHFKDEAEEAASDVLGKYPKIVNDYWYVWDIDQNQYVNTGVLAKGTQGDPGAPGEGVPAGGTTGQVLRKKSDDDYDTEWANGGGGASALDDLTDVSITTPANGDSLEYDATSQDWINGKRKLDLADYETLGAWNLIKNEGTTQTINNVTFTVNSDGSVGTNNNTVTGSDAAFTFYTSKAKFKAGAYYLSGCPSGGSWSTYAVLLRVSDDGVTWSLSDADLGSGDEVVLSADKYIKIEIRVYLGASTGGVTFYPMLALKPGLPYAPYAMTNRELTDTLSVKEITVTGTNTTSNATVTSISCMRYGKVISLEFNCKTTAAVAANDWVRFTLSGCPKPSNMGTASLAQFSGTLVYANIDQQPKVNLRCPSSIPTNTGIQIGFIFLTKD